MPKPIATSADYRSTARRNMSAAIRELTSASVFIERAQHADGGCGAETQLSRDIAGLVQQAQALRMALEER